MAHEGTAILESAGILSPEKSCEITTYYETNTRSSLHWAIVAFAVLGSLLIGSGIILLFAHNWDTFTRPTRAVLSVCPRALGAALSVTVLLKNGGTAWREAAGLFHALAVGASIALIGQAAAFWLLILPPVLRLAYLTRANRDSVETAVSLAGMFVALCVGTGLAFERTVPGLWIVAYSALLNGSGLLGLCLYGEREGWNNLPKTFGVIGMTVLTHLFAWTDMWHGVGWDFVRHDWQYRAWGNWQDSGITLALLAGWSVAAVKAFRRDSIETITLAAFPLLSTLCFVIASLAGQADPFRGRYVQLGFTENYIPQPQGTTTDLDYREPIYATITNDAEGFAHFDGWCRKRPVASAFLKTRYLGDHTVWNEAAKQSVRQGINIAIPFDRYYMDEAKAPRAEQAVRDATRSTNCWATVRILNGKAVVEDVVAKGQSPRTLTARK